MLAQQGAIHLGGVAHRLDVETLLAEIALEQVAQAEVVVDDENAKAFPWANPSASLVGRLAGPWGGK